MLRSNSRGINKLRRGSSGGSKRTKGGSCSYEKMMKTLLLQNQQIIIQQQNMMFMVIKQFQHSNISFTSSTAQQNPTTSTNGTANNGQQQQDQQQHHHQHQHQHHHPISSTGHQQHQVALHHHNNQQQAGSQQLQQQSQSQQQQNLSQQIPTPATPASSQQSSTPASQNQPSHILHHAQAHDEHSIQQHHYFSHHQAGTHTPGPLDTQQQLQQVANHLQENLGSYLTPAQSEQDPISDNKQDEEDFTALMGADDLLGNNLLYNPTTDIGSVTPYKIHQQQQTPSCYSSGCESLTTPRVEQPRQPTTANISQNVVKNLADSFKSPTKPKINVQILSGSETMSMKNNKAKIIQRMNISEFLRQVHHDDGQKSST